MKDIYNSHYLSKFDNDVFFVEPKRKPALTEHVTFKNTISGIRFENDDDVSVMEYNRLDDLDDVFSNESTEFVEWDG